VPGAQNHGATVRKLKWRPNIGNSSRNEASSSTGRGRYLASIGDDNCVRVHHISC
jgi:hypothetical protein